MNSLTGIQSSALFSFLPKNTKNSSSFCLWLPPKRTQESVLGLCEKSGRRENESFAMDAEKLEAELFELMEKSKTPNKFPTKMDLIDSGRHDLVEGISKHGGWLTLGWNLDEEKEEIDGFDDSCSSCNESMENEGEGKSGIEGILSGLEKERSFAYGAELIEKKVNGKKTLRNGGFEQGEDGVHNDRSSKSISLDLDEELFHNSSGSHLQKGISDATMPMWRIWSLQRAGSTTSRFEAAEIVSNDEKGVDNNSNGIVFSNENTVALQKERSVNDNMNGHVSIDKERDIFLDEGAVAASGNTIVEESNSSKIDNEEVSKNRIHLRLKHMECELNSALQLARSRSESAVSDKDEKNSLSEVHRLSDELEFKQTEIMNAKDKLRSTRAKLAVLRGKMIIEEQKMMDVKMKRLDAFQKTLGHLRFVCVVWPNSASEVILVGSFDGWTNQRRMEKSKEGIFTLHLRLYPGQYEIKFIVDGVWMIDPLRPTVCNNGYENNLIIVD